LAGLHYRISVQAGSFLGRRDADCDREHAAQPTRY
jgi:hypothetical protein